MTLKDLITKYEITLKTIQEVIRNSELNEDTLTAQGCERFVKEFLAELRVLSDQPDPKPEWISVEDKLPEEGETVLICTKGGYVTQAYLFTDIAEQSFLETYINNQFFDVTHWQPLPTPPKKG